MINLQLIKYQNANALEATWVDENGAVLKCHSYADVQIDMLRSDALYYGTSLADFETIIAEVEAGIISPQQPTLIEIYKDKWSQVDDYESSLTVTLLNGHKYAANKNARLNIMQERDSLLGIGNNAIEPWLEEWGTFDTNALELQEVLDEALNLLRAYRNSVFGV